jgi:chromosome segregation ATPase
MSEELDKEALNKEMASLNAALDETKKQLNAANEKITAQDAKIADLETKLASLGQLPDQVKQLNEAREAEKRQMRIAEFAKQLNAANRPDAEKLFAEAESDMLWFAKNKEKLMNEAAGGQLLGGKVHSGASSGVEAARQRMIESLHA